MSIVNVNVVVPLSGDGPAASISGIVGSKTVQLSGLFEGYYDLLGTHDDVHFVAYASFDSSGPEGIQVTVPAAVKSVRLRSAARQVTPVTCQVSGSAGTSNGFGTVASIASGFSGLTPIVDLSTIVPPSGPEVDSNFICQGSFQGPIIVLGSVDGISFNPVGEFRVDRRPEGAPPVVDLPPVLTSAKIRYVRLLVSAVVTGAVVVTVGGALPASGGSTATANVGIVTGAAANYLLKADLTASLPIADDLSNQVSTATGYASPPDVVVLGDACELVYSGGPVVVVGHACQAVTLDAVVIGQSIDVGALANPDNPNSEIVAIGRDISLDPLGLGGASELVLVGKNISLPTPLGGNTGANLVVGTNLTVGASGQFPSQFNVLLGYGASIGYQSFGNLVISPQVGPALLNQSQYVISLGNNTPQDSLFNVIAVGQSCAVRNQSQYSSAVGYSITLGAKARQIFAYGVYLSAVADTSASFQRMFVGGSSVQVLNPNTNLDETSLIVGVGHDVTLRANTTTNTNLKLVVALGSSITATTRYFGGDTGAHVVLVGDNLHSGHADGSGVGANNVILIGTNQTSDDDSREEILIGTGCAVLAASGSTPYDCVLIGDTIVVSGPNSSDVVAIGRGITASGILGGVFIGHDITCNSATGTAYNVVIGDDIVFPGDVGLLVAIGWSVSVGVDGQGIAVGTHAEIGASTCGIAIGAAANATSADPTKWAIALGAHATAGAGQFVVGMSDNVLSPNPAMHYFAVRGYNGGNLDTISATDAPADGATGLAVVYNSGGTFSNKTVKAAASPPVGSLLLYVDP